MYYYHLHHWLFFFYFYCMFGWCFESTYVSLKQHKFINRGFMRGPWLPLYGSGAICVLVVTLPFKDHWYLVYLIGAVAATILEYIVGASMVAIFKVRYWDYSYRKIQLHGHICLVSTIAWGFLSLLMVYVVHEPIARFVLSLNDDLVLGITYVITLIMVFDFANAFRQAMDLRALIIRAEQLKEEINQSMDLMKELAKASIEEKIVIANARKDFVADFVGDRLEGPKEKFQEFKFQTGEQVANLEFLTDKHILELKEKMAVTRKKMLDPIARPLSQNPGFKMPSLKRETSIIEALLKKRKDH